MQKMRSPAVEKMRSPTYFVLVLGTVGLLLVSREVGAQSGGKGHDATSLCDELITPNKYECFEHRAVTDDGFILGIQNIPSRRGLGNAPSNGPPVLLQHGLTAAYWAWTYDELATYDLKTSVEFVYNSTGKKLSYIGHSLGTTILIAGLTNGRFNTTVRGYLNSAVLLAPKVFTSSETAPGKKSLFIAYSLPGVYAAGAKEFSGYQLAQVPCGFPAVDYYPNLCFALFSASIGNTSYTNISRLGFYSQYFPQSTSTYNLNHLGQGTVRGTFAFYDKGAKDNQATYGQLTAPNYNISSFPADLPTQYWTGGIDGDADPVDVAAALKLLPSSNREVHTLPNYGHTDFILGTNAYIDVYPSLIAFIKKYV